MSVKKFLTAIAIIGLMLFMVMTSANTVRAQPGTLNSVWVSPGTINYSTNNATVGTLFNVTVWANVQNGTYVWQVTLNFDPSVFQEVACGYTAGATSSFFSGHTTIPVTPSVDNVGGSVLFGESLLGSDFIPPNNASLMYVEFNITGGLTSTTPTTGLFDINATGLTGTFIEDPNGIDLVQPSNFNDASYALSLAVPPGITDISQTPTTTSVNDSEAVVVFANVTDYSGTGIANATIVYSADGFTTNYTAPMTLDPATGLYNGTIPGYIGGTIVDYVIQAYDNSGGFYESSPSLTYTVLPEYAALSLLLIMIAMLAVAILIARKKHGK